MPRDAHQQPELFPACDVSPHFTIAVRVDGKRSHVETHAGLDAATEAGKQYLWNPEIAWVILGYHDKRVPYYSHRMVRRGEEITVKEWNGRENRAGRSKVKSGQTPAALG